MHVILKREQTDDMNASACWSNVLTIVMTAVGRKILRSMIQHQQTTSQRAGAVSPARVAADAQGKWSDVLVEQAPCALQTPIYFWLASVLPNRNRKPVVSLVHTPTPIVPPGPPSGFHQQQEADIIRLWFEADSCRPTGASIASEMSGPRFDNQVQVEISRICHASSVSNLQIELCRHKIAGVSSE